MAMPDSGTYAKNGEKAGSNGLVRWLMTSLLTTVVGELPAMRLVSHNSDPLSPKQCHLFQPSGTIKAQPRQDWGQIGRNIAPLVGPNCTACPVNQHQIVRKGIGQAVRFELTGKRQQ